MIYYNPHITGQYNPLYTANNQGFFRGSIVFSPLNGSLMGDESHGTK